MSVVIITGSTGLIGSECSKFFLEKGYEVIGIDNDMRSYFFGPEASTHKNVEKLEKYPLYTHQKTDIRNFENIANIFKQYKSDISLVIHTAAQPSHDWAAKEPFTDFSINANGTMNLLEATRQYCPDAVFIFTSTNKVYGDTPNNLPIVESPTRWEIDSKHHYHKEGIDENMTIDQSKHSIFGASKLAADVLVQEYGKYFGMKTSIFRGGCLTGPAHSGAELHGFLSYLVLCAAHGTPYTIFGYDGKQVRDKIHSKDLVNAFWHVFNEPRIGEVYNIGGSRHSNVSVLEAIDMIETLGGGRVNYTISDKARIGDHIWYISDVRKFKNHYPSWDYEYNMESILKEMIAVAKI
jgi:CDP-paratose 2-epimerase